MIARHSATVAAIAAVSAGPALADFDFCYTGDAPPGVTATPPDDPRRGAVLGLGFGYHWLPALYRRACGLAGDADRLFYRREAEALGCSPGSDLGRHLDEGVTQIIGTPLAELDEGPFLAALREERPEEFASFCSTVAEMPLPLAPRPAADAATPRVDPAFRDGLRRVLEAHIALREKYPTLDPARRN